MRKLKPPVTLEGIDVFILVWDRATDSYILSVQSGQSYELGNTEDTLIYFSRLLDNGKYCELAERAMDCARNWYTAVVVPKKNRCFSAEIAEKKDGYNHLFNVERSAFVIV